MKRQFVTVSRRRCTSPPEVGVTRWGDVQGEGAHGEAPELVTRQRDQWKNVGKRLYCGFLRKKWGRESKFRIGWFE